MNMGTPPSAVVVFLLGCLGALAPEIVRLYELRWKLHEQKFSYIYFVISAMYADLGGALAVGLPAVSWYAAIYCGVTVPCTISTMAKSRKPKVIYCANSREIPPLEQKDYPLECARAVIPKFVWLRNLKKLVQTHADGLFL